MKKSSNILKQTTTVLILTLVIKALGFVKQAVLAAIYGTTLETDAFYISSGIINALCNVTFSAISISLLSMYARKIVVDDKKRANQLISQTLLVFMPIAAGITMLFYFGAPVAAKLFAPSYEGRAFELLSANIRILSFLFIFWCYFLILNVVAEANKKFLPGKGYAFFQNLFIIIAALIFPQAENAKYLTYAFVFAGIVQCIWITYSVRKYYRPNLKARGERQNISELLHLMIPLLIGNAIYEINDIVDKQISSGLGHGNTSVLTYGASINEIITTVIITSVTTVLFSHFATWAAEKNLEKIQTHLQVSNECLAAITLPATVICIMNRKEIVTILFGRGNFNEQSIRLTAGVVFGYALGFVFQAMRANLVKVFYAFGDTRRPMINGAISIGCNICMSIVLSRFMGVAGIAVATSIAMLIATILLSVQLKNYLPDYSFAKSAKEYGKIILSICVSGMCMFAVQHISTNIWLSMIIKVGSFGISYVVMMIILKSKTVDFAKKMICK